MNTIDYSTIKRVIECMLLHTDSFIIQYPEPRPHNMCKWFLVSGPESRWSSTIADEVGELLLKKGYIIPELSDKEYKIQIALGSIDCRVYKLVYDQLMKK